MSTLSLTAVTPAYPFITERIQCAVYAANDLARTSPIQFQIDTTLNHPSKIWTFTGLYEGEYIFSIDIIDINGIKLDNITILDVIPSNLDNSIGASMNDISDVKKLISTRGDKLEIFGDSISANTPPGGKRYSELLADDLNIACVNHAIGGDMSCDIFSRQIAPTLAGTTLAERSLIALMIGTNDVAFNGGVSGYDLGYKNRVTACITWLAIPIESKILAASASLGGGASLWTPFAGSTMQAALGGTMSFNSLQTYGYPIYLWYIIDDDLTGSFRVLLNGTPIATCQTNPTPDLNSGNAPGNSSVAVLSIPVAAGINTISIDTVTGSFGILGTGTVPADYARKAVVVLGQIPPQNANINDLSEPQYILFRSRITEIVAELKSVGFDIRLLNTSDYWDKYDNAAFLDHVHPTQYEHKRLFDAFGATFKAIPSSSDTNKAGQEKVGYIVSTGSFTIPMDADIIMLNGDSGTPVGTLPALSSVGASSYFGQVGVTHAQITKRIINLGSVPYTIHANGSDAIYDFSTPDEPLGDITIQKAEVYTFIGFFPNGIAPSYWFAFLDSNYKKTVSETSISGRLMTVRIDASGSNVVIPMSDYVLMDIGGGSIVLPPSNSVGASDYDGSFGVVHSQISTILHNASPDSITVKPHASDAGIVSFDAGTQVIGNVTIAAGMSRRIIGFFPNGVASSYIYVSKPY